MLQTVNPLWLQRDGKGKYREGGKRGLNDGKERLSVWDVESTGDKGIINVYRVPIEEAGTWGETEGTGQEGKEGDLDLNAIGKRLKL